MSTLTCAICPRLPEVGERAHCRKCGGVKDSYIASLGMLKRLLP